MAQINKIAHRHPPSPTPIVQLRLIGSPPPTLPSQPPPPPAPPLPLSDLLDSINTHQNLLLAKALVIDERSSKLWGSPLTLQVVKSIFRYVSFSVKIRQHRHVGCLSTIFLAKHLERQLKVVHHGGHDELGLAKPQLVGLGSLNVQVTAQWAAGRLQQGEQGVGDEGEVLLDSGIEGLIAVLFRYGWADGHGRGRVEEGKKGFEVGFLQGDEGGPHDLNVHVMALSSRWSIWYPSPRSRPPLPPWLPKMLPLDLDLNLPPPSKVT